MLTESVTKERRTTQVSKKQTDYAKVAHRLARQMSDQDKKNFFTRFESWEVLLQTMKEALQYELGDDFDPERLLDALSHDINLWTIRKGMQWCAMYGQEFEDLVREAFDCREVTCETPDKIWIEDPQEGQYLNDNQLHLLAAYIRE